MARKDRVVRRVDERNDNIKTGGGDLIQIGSAAPTQGGIIQPPEPTNVVIGTQVLLRTTYTPKVAVNVSWGAPPNLLPEFYLVEYAEDSNFTVNVIRVTTSLNRIALEMKPDTDYWVRVKAMIRGMYSDWAYPANYPTVSVHTIGDTTPPGPVTGVTANWSTGDLILKWTNPSSQNFFQTRVRIYNTFGGTLFKEIYIVGNPGSKSEYRFTVDENNDVTGNNPLTSVYYEILAYSLVGVPAVSAVTGTITKAKPSIPTGLSSSWAGDDGTFDEGVTISWNNVAGAKDYRVVIDGVEKWTTGLQYVYPYTENLRDHRPTLVSGDQNLAFTVQSRDPLNQVSPGASGTATNIAPQASNMALTTVPGFSSLYAYITLGTDIKDLHHYTWVLKSGGVNVKEVISSTPETSFTTLNGIYDLQVYAVDMFGQKSATLSGTVTLDGLTIGQLRAETMYTNSLGTNPTTLAGLKDNNLVQSVFTVPSGTIWQWTKAERPLLDRYRTFTVAFSGAPTNMPRVYFSTSSDDTNFTYFSGPLVSTGAIAGNTTLTQYASEASAQSNAILAVNINRFDLPSITEARFIKMHHRGNIHNVAEWYPRRVVQSDDMEAESIKAINIAANAIIADHISVTELSAITANIGQLVINTGGYLWQGTGTAASPTTGLKIHNVGGIGRLTTYSAGVVQIDLDSTGRLLAGAGNSILDANGLKLVERNVTYGTLAPAPNNVAWKTSGGANVASIEAIFNTAPEWNQHQFVIINHQSGGNINLLADAVTVLSRTGTDVGTLHSNAMDGSTLVFSNGAIDKVQVKGSYVLAGRALEIKGNYPVSNGQIGGTWYQDTDIVNGGRLVIIYDFLSMSSGNILHDARNVFTLVPDTSANDHDAIIGGLTGSSATGTLWAKSVQANGVASQIVHRQSSTVGGMGMQGILSADTSFSRGWVGHNALWNDTDNLWHLDNVGANDAEGMLITNGDIYFIRAPTTGASARTFTHANFLLQSAMHINANGIYADAGWFRSVDFSTGWYHEAGAGGWYMTDTTWIRAYNNKAVLVTNVVRADSGFRAPGNNGANADYAIDLNDVPQSFAVGAGAVFNPFSNANVFAGLVYILDETNGASALFITSGGVTALIRESTTNTFTITNGTANRINFYWSGTALAIHNGFGVSHTLRVMSFRSRAAN